MTASAAADAVVLGGGVIGLACAAALARDGASVILIDEQRSGSASAAAAGMLAPSIDRARGPAYDFAIAARDRYPAVVEWLADATGIAVPLNQSGILQLAITEAGVRGLRRAMSRDADGAAEWIDARAVRALEPSLAHALGAVYHPGDGAVDNIALLRALTAFCRSSPTVTCVEGAADSVDFGPSGAAVRTSDGQIWRGRFTVIATGVWTASVAGLPRPVPVTPLRGQMLAWRGTPVRHVLFGPRGYIIPRPGASGDAGETLVGATSERVGFDAATTAAGAAALGSAGLEILPALGNLAPARHWAGLRPMTPDLLPIIGPDPDRPALLYACGHSRNGILMAPLTGDCISALVRGVATPASLEAFTIGRFATH